MEGAEEELERRSRFLTSLIKNNNKKKKKNKEKEKKNKFEQQQQQQVISTRLISNASACVRATDMPYALQDRALRCARDSLDSMSKLDTKRLALALKEEFDASYGQAWHCVVGTSFGSYVTHSLGGFLYFSIDNVYILLFKTAVEP